MEVKIARVRQNYLAILIAAIACFLLEAVWYSIFLQTWLNGTGRSMEWLMNSGMNLGVQYLTAILSAVVMSAAISCVVQLTGPQTVWRGIRVAALLWLGFVVTSWTTEYIFEVRPISLWAVNCGFWLLGMMLEGAIVGGWKKK